MNHMSMNTTPMNTTQNALQDGIHWRAPLLFGVAGLLLFGLVYSALGAVLGKLVFPQQATGSLIERNGQVIGSRLLAQPFAAPGYFHPRPSAANYDPMAAAGSNMARSNPELQARITATISEVARREGIAPAQVPADLASQSGGGLDPHISPAGAQVQLARVARARGLTPSAVETLVRKHTAPALWGVVGAARVNVLELNLALDALPRPALGQSDAQR